MSATEDLPALLSRVGELEALAKDLEAKRLERETAWNLEATRLACEERVKRLEKDLVELEAKAVKTRTIRAEEPKYYEELRGKVQLPEADWDDEILALFQAVIVNGPWTNDLRQAFGDKLARLGRLERRLVVRAAFAMGFVMRSKAELTFAKVSLQDLEETAKEIADDETRLFVARHLADQVHVVLSSIEFDVWGAKPEAKAQDYGAFGVDQTIPEERQGLPWHGASRKELRGSGGILEKAGQGARVPSYPSDFFMDGESDDQNEGLYLGE
jgi:hypothetical protein